MIPATPTTADRSRTKAVTCNRKPTPAQIAEALNSTTYAFELIGTARKLAKRLPPKSASAKAQRSQYIVELLEVGMKLLRKHQPTLIQAGIIG